MKHRPHSDVKTNHGQDRGDAVTHIEGMHRILVLIRPNRQNADNARNQSKSTGHERKKDAQQPKFLKERYAQNHRANVFRCR